MEVEGKERQPTFLLDGFLAIRDVPVINFAVLYIMTS